MWPTHHEHCYHLVIPENVHLQVAPSFRDPIQAANRHDLSFQPLHTHRVRNMFHSHDSERTLMAGESGIMAHEEDAQTK